MNGEQASGACYWLLGGQVQGVGFRPFVYRLALAHRLSGWTRNLGGEVEILAQGRAESLRAFGHALLENAPPLARPVIHQHQSCPPQAELAGFEILASDAGQQPRIHLPPDYFICDDCLAELRDPSDRRFGYPFINCTQCGPRYTVITALPYDRINTTLKDFPLCADCAAEYQNPADRRFHAEPLACPRCGPTLSFQSAENAEPIRATAAALESCLRALRAGRIVAIKGVGGYHLACDAANQSAVERLRRHKPRPDKPLALMFPWEGADGLAGLRQFLDPTSREADLLRSPARPIVLIRRRESPTLAPGIAPGLREIGAMLPYSPLHHLLLEAFAAPLVMTSANPGGEPVLIENREVAQRLGRVAEAFLHHDRPIARPADDSVFRQIAGRMRPLRLGRGRAPLEWELPRPLPAPVLALGTHHKNTLALAWEQRVVLSPHIGDLDSPRALEVFHRVARDLQALYQIKAERLITDAHPGYAGTRQARRMGLPVARVFHHQAHASALAGEFPDIRRWLVFAWDGVGYGEDGGLWGGEALLGAPGAWRRVASLRPFALPGGEKAGREPWRAAAGACWSAGLDWSPPLTPPEMELLRAAWQRGLNCPDTSAAGRLFDAAASLTGLCHRASFEGQGPMLLEAAAEAWPSEQTSEARPVLDRDAQGFWRGDWRSLLPPLMDQRRPVARRAAEFHADLARLLEEQALAIHEETPVEAVGLSGGVFQNRLLSERVMSRLTQVGFPVYLGKKIPCNDAGISFGQVIEVCSGYYFSY